MALLFADSFAHYTYADRDLKWSFSNNQGGSMSATGGRWGGQALNFTHGNDHIYKTVPSVSTLIVGCAVWSDGWNGNHKFMALLDSGTIHLYLSFDGSGHLALYRGDGTLLSASSYVMPNSVWVYVEMKATIHDSTGAAAVRVNGESVITLSGVDTRNGGNASANQARLGGTGNIGLNTARYNDFYLCDTSGSTNNDFLGDVRVQAIFPNGNGNSSQLVGSDGNSTDNYLLVDETTPNDADYVESSNVGDKDTYAYGNVTPTSGTVYAVQVVSRAAKTDAGTRSIASVARLSSTEEDSANKALTTTYQYHSDIRETKPGGGSWTISDLNAAEFGVKVTA